MKYINIAGTDLKASNIIMGCMRIKQLSLPEAEALIRTAMEENVNFFDHADIYGGGECEEHFAQAIGMNPSIRDGMILQSKCGIRSGYFDFSKEHILASTDGILKRLNTDYLDILLLHRPDSLVEPEEVAEAFDQLQASGKVRHFGVSNHTPLQIELLKKYVKQPLVVNQLQLSVTHTPMIDSGIALNMDHAQSVNRDSGILDYSRLHDMTVQAWSPFQKGFFNGPFLGDLETYPELNKLMDELAAKYEVTTTAIAVAWITRHPANIQVITGTTNVTRLKDSCQGSDIPLTREEWYAMYKAGGKIVP
ncbi:aldo/keto reductase [Paenibacillus sp. PL2-23]|uniref:aldo/keto reductase n=1 Tax=Paenibacillus sp. PL2-23 TaxID=2100729 RepID=UPI0030F8B1AC